MGIRPEDLRITPRRAPATSRARSACSSSWAPTRCSPCASASRPSGRGRARCGSAARRHRPPATARRPHPLVRRAEPEGDSGMSGQEASRTRPPPGSSGTTTSAATRCRPRPLPVPVELGQLPVAGLGPPRRGPGLPGDRDAAQWPVAGRDGAAHRVPPARSRLFSRAGAVGHPPRAHDFRHHPAARRSLLRPAHPGGRTRSGLAERRARDLFPRLARHRWFHTVRDPDGTGMVTTLHPWETGMDNSPAWDEVLAQVEVAPDSSPTSARTPPTSTRRCGRPRPSTTAT